MIGIVLSVAALAGFVFAGASPASAQTLTTVNFAYTGALSPFTPEMMIQDNPDMCAPFGVKPVMSSVAPATAINALAAGQLDMVHVGPGSVLISAAKDPTTVRIVGAQGAQPTTLYLAKGLTSAKDLKGKTVGVSAPGSNGDLLMREVLAQAKLNAYTDVSVTYSGTAAALVGLGAAGTIQGFIFIPPLPAADANVGWHQVATLAGSGHYDALGASTYNANAGFLKAHKSAVKGILACIDAANKSVADNPDGAAASQAKVLKIDQVTAYANVKANASAFTMKPYPVADAKFLMSVLAKNNLATFGSFNPKKIIDNSLLPKSPFVPKGV